jgi:hypothetical protein
VWIGIGGADGDPSFAVVIPRDVSLRCLSPLPARLDASFQKSTQNEWNLRAMSARVGDPTASQSTDFVPPVWSSLWEIQRHETLLDLGHAGIAARELAKVERALQEKTNSPVAAAIAATVLIRCGALNQLHDWPRNLANWFEWLPDGAALWAETLLRRDGIVRPQNLAARPQASAAGEKRALRDDAAEVHRLAAEPAYQEARTYFAKLADRGPPLLAASLTMAARQVRFWKRVVEVKAVTDQAYLDLKDACEVVERAAAYALPDGAFAAFASHAGVLAPHDVLGGRRRKAALQQKTGRSKAA